MRRVVKWSGGIVVLAGLAVAGVLWLAPPCAQPALTLRKIVPLGATQACAPAKMVASEEKAPAPLPPAVTVVKADTHDFIDRFFVSGTLVARDEAMVGAQIDGLRIVEILADDGDRVTKGQVLARLDRSQLDTLVAQNDAALARADASIAQAQSQIAQFEAALAQAQADYDRARKLDVQIITQATLDQRLAAFRTAQSVLAAGKNALAVARADKASQEAQRRELMVRIDRTEVKAPVAGVVSRRTARLGAVAMAAQDALFRIVTDGAVELEADVPEQSLARLRVGMEAKIVLPGSPNEVVAKVRLISEEVDKTTRLGKVRIALPLDAPARIGSFASGVVIVARSTGVGVPTSSVARGDDGDYVLVVKDDKIERREIAVGITNRRLTEARQGLAAGETVVARAEAFLRPGDLVRPLLTQPSDPKEASK